MSIDIIQAIRDGQAYAEWATLTAEHNGHKLKLAVMRDALKFDGLSPMTWRRKPLAGDDRLFDGVRYAASAVEMQQVADVLHCMLMTPKVVDMVWLEAALSGIRFNPVINLGPGKIVANAHIHLVHEAIEKKIAAAGGDPGDRKFIAAVGKYWVLVNALLYGKFGKQQAVNYGWLSSSGRYRAVTAGLKCWQSPGSRHDNTHYDPSQVIRLMYRSAYLLRAGSSVWEEIDLTLVLGDPELAPLISHEGVLKCMRLPGVPEPTGVTEDDGSLTLPEMIFLGDPWGDDCPISASMV